MNPALNFVAPKPRPSCVCVCLSLRESVYMSVCMAVSVCRRSYQKLACHRV